MCKTSRGGAVRRRVNATIGVLRRRLSCDAFREALTLIFFGKPQLQLRLRLRGEQWAPRLYRVVDVKVMMADGMEDAVGPGMESMSERVG